MVDRMLKKALQNKQKAETRCVYVLCPDDLTVILPCRGIRDSAPSEVGRNLDLQLMLCASVMGAKDTGIVHYAFGSQMTGLVHPGSRPKRAGFMEVTKQSRGEKLESIKFLLYTKKKKRKGEVISRHADEAEILRLVQCSSRDSVNALLASVHRSCLSALNHSEKGQRVLLGCSSNNEAPVEIDVDSSLSAVDTKLDTKVLIHGWHGSPSSYKSIIAAVDTKLDTKVLIHGWHGSPYSYKSIIAAYLARGDVNVITVDWTALSKSMDYTASKADTEVTGTRVAQLLDNLADKGLDLSRVNCVGHSLGGQTAGVVGDRLTKGVLGMITGLDPAGPLFGNNTPKKDKLDPEDAAYVQIIHTNAGKLGSAEMAGHADFMPNGGIKQTNCKGIGEITESGKMAVEQSETEDALDEREGGNSLSQVEIGRRQKEGAQFGGVAEGYGRENSHWSIRTRNIGECCLKGSRGIHKEWIEAMNLVDVSPSFPLHLRPRNWREATEAAGWQHASVISAEDDRLKRTGSLLLQDWRNSPLLQVARRERWGHYQCVSGWHVRTCREWWEELAACEWLACPNLQGVVGGVSSVCISGSYYHRTESGWQQACPWLAPVVVPTGMKGIAMLGTRYYTGYHR
uniref:Lipase domain-containing protein n=1 Tax=Timema monikensis TaxID=170555 RepID=A0A7R9EDN8_9NEOP|nr:unnamed protein product [Timema monikensis]